MKRTKVRRVVEVIPLEDAMDAFKQRIRNGFLYGDFQYGIDLQPADGRWVGVFSCYEAVPPETPLTESPRELSSDDWLRIVGLCHVDPAETVRMYTQYYLSTSGQVYWSDTHQLSVYVNDYHARLDAADRPARAPGSEMISEVYVPRDRFADFMHAARRALIAEGIHPIYGTVRLIERDEESFLRWAAEPWACIIWNLHVEHDDAGLVAARRRFVRLIDEALERSGSYYLTYHRWARKDQVERAYPQMREFLRRKRELDPEELFQSDWYRHYREMYGI
jgi:FAD/FMN-containing dehydrogenase